MKQQMININTNLLAEPNFSTFEKGDLIHIWLL